MLNRRTFLQGYALLAAAPAMAWVPSPASAQAPAKRPNQAPGFFRMMLGDVEVTALYDGMITVPAGILHGAKAKDINALLEFGFVDPAAGLPTPINAYLVNTGRNLVLVDTGAGGFFGPKSGLLPGNIRAAGYALEDIDTVCLTHLHSDHALGLVDAGGKALFPRAEVRAGRADADYWLSDTLLAVSTGKRQEFLKALRGALAPYIADGRFKPFSAGESARDGIEAVPLPGHTPGHYGFRVSSKGQGLLVWGDIMHCAAVQFPRPEVSVDFDVDQPWAATTRKVLLADLAREQTWVAGIHLPFPGLGRIRTRGKGYVWMPADYGVPAAG